MTEPTTEELIAELCKRGDFVMYCCTDGFYIAQFPAIYPESEGNGSSPHEALSRLLERVKVAEL